MSRPPGPSPCCAAGTAGTTAAPCSARSKTASGAGKSKPGKSRSSASRCLSESNAEPDRADLHPLSHARRFAFSHHRKAWAGPLRGPAHALLLTFLPLLRSTRRFRQAGPPRGAPITVRGDIAAAGSPRPPVAPPNRLALSLLPALFGSMSRSCRHRPFPSPFPPSPLRHRSIVLHRHHLPAFRLVASLRSASNRRPRGPSSSSPVLPPGTPPSCQANPTSTSARAASRPGFPLQSPLRSDFRSNPSRLRSLRSLRAPLAENPAPPP